MYLTESGFFQPIGHMYEIVFDLADFVAAGGEHSTSDGKIIVSSLNVLGGACKFSLGEPLHLPQQEVELFEKMWDRPMLYGGLY